MESKGGKNTSHGKDMLRMFNVDVAPAVLAFKLAFFRNAAVIYHIINIKSNFSVRSFSLSQTHRKSFLMPPADDYRGQTFF